MTRVRKCLYLKLVERSPQTWLVPTTDPRRYAEVTRHQRVPARALRSGNTRRVRSGVLTLRGRAGRVRYRMLWRFSLRHSVLRAPPGFSAHVGKAIAPDPHERLADQAAYFGKSPVSLEMGPHPRSAAATASVTPQAAAETLACGSNALSISLRRARQHP